MKLSLTYSAYRELEQLPREPLQLVGEALVQLAEDPYPPGATMVHGWGGCYYLAIDDYYILYYFDRDEESLTVLGVLYGAEHPLH